MTNTVTPRCPLRNAVKQNKQRDAACTFETTRWIANNVNSRVLHLHAWPVIANNFLAKTLTFEMLLLWHYGRAEQSTTALGSASLRPNRQGITGLAKNTYWQWDSASRGVLIELHNSADMFPLSRTSRQRRNFFVALLRSSIVTDEFRIGTSIGCPAHPQ